MARVVNPRLKFRPSTSPDVVAHRVRAGDSYEAEYVEITEDDPAADGYVRVPVSLISFLAGVEGDVEVFITSVDNAGNESDFLRVAGPLDLSPPAAPTDGSIE